MDSGNRRSTIHATGRTAFALRLSENTPPFFACAPSARKFGNFPRRARVLLIPLGPRPTQNQGFCVQNLLQRISHS